MIIYQQSKSKQNLSIPIRIAKISTYSRNAVFLQNTIVVTFMSQYLAHMWSLKKHIKRIHILRAKCKQSMDRRTPLLEIIYQHITLARLWPNNYIQSMSSLLISQDLFIWYFSATTNHKAIFYKIHFNLWWHLFLSLFFFFLYFIFYFKFSQKYFHKKRRRRYTTILYELRNYMN